VAGAIAAFNAEKPGRLEHAPESWLFCGEPAMAVRTGERWSSSATVKVATAITNTTLFAFMFFS